MSLDVEKFVGMSYKQVGDCWGLVRAVCGEAGIGVPFLPEQALASQEAIADVVPEGELPRAGDIAVMPGGDADRGGLHVGVLADSFRVIHATREAGVRIDQISNLRRVGGLLRIVRMRAGAGREKPAAESMARGAVTVTTFADPIARLGRERHEVEIPPAGTTARAAAARAWGWRDSAITDHRRMLVVVNGKALAHGEDVRLRDGDQVVSGPPVGEPVTIVMAILSVALAVGSALLAPRPRLNGPGDNRDGERRYGFGRFSREAFAGGTIPVAMGYRPRWGWHVVGVVPGEAVDGSGDNTLKVLLCGGHGRIEAIGDQTADFDRLAGEDLDGVYLNDQPITAFPGCRVSGRMGTAGQLPMPGFEDSEVAVEVGVGGAALLNTSGSERTGAGSSAEAFMYTTTLSVDAFVVRVRLPRGLYTTTASATLEATRVRYRVRHRTADVGSGAGAWSDWIIYQVEKAEQSEFYSSPRIGGAGGLGAAARRDIEVERVSVDETDLVTVSDLVWDQVVEVVDADNTYAGYAMLGLELRASEQLTGVPRVSVATKGVRVRVWDGVSSPSSPTFAAGYSNNPADLALEAITNTVWGMGSIYPDAAIDMASLFAWRTACAVSVSKPAGGTRPRFAFNYVFDEAADGVDLVRTICRAGRCTPVKAGRVWRFIMDDTQSAPVERFTQGSILVDEDGVAQVEYTREHAVGGINRPNQTVAQFENEEAAGKPDSREWPADGDEWLGGSEPEPLNTRAVRLDGETDPDQVYSACKYLAKKDRFLTRGIAFKTVRDVLLTQPGDRFDLAVDLPQWGTASGRVLAGCTTTGLRLDRELTIEAATAYLVRIIHADGTEESKAVSSGAGTYASGEEITLASALGAAPTFGAEYVVGVSGVEMKPFVCSGVRLVDADRRVWEVSGFEYAADVYDDAADTVTIPDYSDLKDLTVPPGPVINLRAFERTINGVLQVVLSWRQTPEDARMTGSFRVWRRIVGTATWVPIPGASVTTRSATVDVFDTDRGYEFKVSAVSLGGAFLSPDDPRVPLVGMVLGLATAPPPPPDSVTLTGTGGNTYTLSWDAVDEAVEYQVLFGGTSTGLPNDGAEDCLVLARTEATEITGLELTPGESCTFWVRSVGANGRLSWTAASVTEATPGTPAGETIRSTRTFALDSEGTLDNVVWNATPTRLELVNAAAEGVYTSPEVDLTTAEVTELTVRPFTENDADDPALYTDPFVVPSIAADQWGVVSTGPKVVGMLMPPWPDASQAWELEVRVHDGAGWGAWESLAWCGSVRETMQKYQVRVSMRRAAAPYRPGLGGLVVVTTAAGGGGGGSTSDGSWDWSNADESGVLWAGTGD